MHVSKASQRGGRRYVCPAGPGGSGGCGRIAIAAEPTETIIIEGLLTALDGPALARARKRPASRRKGDDPAREVADVDTRLAELADLFAAGEIGGAEWIRARAGLEERRDRAMRRIDAEVSDSAAARVRARAGSLRAEWSQFTSDEQREVLRAIVDRVTVAPAAIKGKYDPDRLDVVWRA